MNTLTLKIPDGTKTQIDTYAEHKGTSKSHVVREALAAYFVDNIDNQANKGSFFDLAKDVAGTIQGPVDLSSNKQYLAEYGNESNH